MSETLTGRTRLRQQRDYGADMLVLEVEISTGAQDPDTGASLTCWRDAMIQDITSGDYEPAMLKAVER